MTIDEIIKKNEEAGHTFFSKENMRWFRSRVHSKVYEGIGGIFFVTSEQRGNGGIRYYSVRGVCKSGDIKANGMKFATPAGAHSAARTLSNVEGLDIHHGDAWVPVPGGEALEKIVGVKNIWLRKCPRTGSYMVPEWVLTAMQAYRMYGFADLTEKEFLTRMAK